MPPFLQFVIRRFLVIPVSLVIITINHLIQRERLIDEILPDLARLAKSHPRDARVWQTLGDALARAGRLDHATQSYKQAQKLRQ